MQAWETADILPFDAFVERLWEDALYSDLASGLPLLLTAAQEQVAWEDIISGSPHADGLLDAAAAALEARSAWHLAHAWRLLGRLDRAESSEDARAFVEWAGRFERLTRQRQQTDRARLPDVLAPLLAHPALRKPAALVLYGFDIVTPQSRDFLAALAAQGVEVMETSPRSVEARVRRVVADTAKDEIDAAAKFARGRLEANADARIGIVVPDLSRSRERVRRMFANVLQPDHLMPGAASRALPFDISLGSPLAHYPLVADALCLLRLAGREVDFEEASRLVRSPFIAGGEAEMVARARLDLRIRDRAAVALGLDDLIHLAASAGPRAPILLDRLARLAAFRKSDLFGAKDPSDWARAVSEALTIVGFPGERTLDSAEYQALRKWHEVLACFATLERVSGKLRYQEVCSRFARMASDTVFQPETPDVPIAILGVLESAGLEFDHLWVMGLTDDAWPMAPRPNPFIPVRVQREAGVPESDAQSSLELDRRITQGWRTAAAEVVFSHARMRDDAELIASPLIAHIGQSDSVELAIPAFASLAEAIHARRAVERIPDGRAPAVTVTTLPGGTGLFQNQAACPFRAFARNRLGSQPVASPQPGLDAMERGTLLHAVLAAVWDELEDKAHLDSIGEAQLVQVVSSAADAAITKLRRARPGVLEGRFALIERDRLTRIAHDWLAFEKQRGDFAVVATERKKPVTFGGITVNAKLDRLDRLAQGGHAILDYKTGTAAVASWLGPRPDEPQLPMYALGGEEEVAALAFARLKPGAFEFRGLAREEGLLPGVKTIAKNRGKDASGYADWSALREGWKRELDALGVGFASGDARVDPKRGDQTCRYCDQQLFCRIAEKRPALDGSVVGEDAQADD